MEKLKPYGGIVVPVVSPAREDTSPDFHSLAGLIEHVVSAGAHPFLFGTTGEGASLSQEYRQSVVERTVQLVNGRSKIYVGISGNCLDDSIRAGERFACLGADVLVAHVPFYLPMDEQMAHRYFEQLADRLPKPLILYNIPVTTHYSLPVEVIEVLGGHPNIAGIKDSEANDERMVRLITFCKDRDDFSYLLGWTAGSVQAMEAGADGIVPSNGNAFPDWYVELMNAVRANDMETAWKLQRLSDEVTSLLQKGRNLSHSIAALKLLLSEMDLCLPWVFPPLNRMDPAEESFFREKLRMLLPDFLERAKDISG